MQEARLDTDSTLLVFLTDLTGAPKTGVVKAELDLHACYVGGASAGISQANINWTEVDSSDQPGWYFMEVLAVAFSALGTLGMTLNPTGGAVFTPWNEYVQVVTRYKEDILRRVLGLTKQNTKLTVTGTNALGYMTSGTLEIFDDNGMVSKITEYTVTVSYDSVSGELQEHRVLET